MRKAPQRTCLACGAKADKRSLLRLVRTADGTLAFDPGGKMNGRGAYLCRDCADVGAAMRKIRAALGVQAGQEDAERLDHEIKRHIFELSMGGRLPNAKKGL